MERMAATGGGATSLWCDTESCPLPSYVDPYIVVSIASALFRNFNIIVVSMASALFRNFNIIFSGSMVKAGGQTLHNHLFSAYEFFSETQTELRQTLINSGIRLP